MKFMGPVVGDLEHAEYFMYFLNPKNHKPGTPIDMISYHVFSMPDADESDDEFDAAGRRSHDAGQVVTVAACLARGEFEP